MYAIMRIEKRKKSEIRGIQAENNRNAEQQKNFICSDIDYARTNQNYYFVKSDDFKDSIERKLKANGIEKYRKDAVLCLDGLYTASPEFFQNKNREDIVKYFAECLEFHKKSFGDVFNAVIHFDETTPHLHVQSVPIFEKKLCAKKIMGNIKNYHILQDRFYADVAQKLGFDRGQIRDDEHKRNHLTSLKYKIQKQSEELQKREKENKILEAENRKQAKDIVLLKEHLQKMTAKIQYVEKWLEAEKQIDNDLEIQALNRKRTREKER